MWIIVVQLSMSKLHYLCVGRDGIRMIINSSDPCLRDNLITDTLSAGAIVISFRLSFGVYFCRYIKFTKALLPWPHHSYPHS